MLRTDLARLTGLADFAPVSGAPVEAPAMEPPPPRPGMPGNDVLIAAELGDLLDGILVASRTRDLPALVALEAAAQPYLTDAQAQVLTYWVDTLQTAL